MSSILAYLGRAVTSNWNNGRIARTISFSVTLGDNLGTTFDLGSYIGPSKDIDNIQGMFLNNITSSIKQISTLAGSYLILQPLTTYMGPIFWGLDNRITFLGTTGDFFNVTFTNFPVDFGMFADN
jgi:hypothetical protein